MFITQQNLFHHLFVCRILAQYSGSHQLNYFQRYRSSILQEWCGKSWKQVDNASKFLINSLTNKHRENLSKLQQFNARRRMMPQAKYPECFVRNHTQATLFTSCENIASLLKKAGAFMLRISFNIFMMKTFKSVIKGFEQTFQ